MPPHETVQGLFFTAMKTIQLTKGQVAIVDDDNFEILNQHKWFANSDKRNMYAARNINLENGKQKIVKMHRVIMNVADPKIICDHINRNTLDNRKENLRTCSIAENGRNRKNMKNSLSKYKGVCWHKYHWEARITFNKKIMYLGGFKTEIEAALAYNKKSIELHGEFASPNTI